MLPESFRRLSRPVTSIQAGFEAPIEATGRIKPPGRVKVSAYGVHESLEAGGEQDHKQKCRRRPERELASG